MIGEYALGESASGELQPDESAAILDPNAERLGDLERPLFFLVEIEYRPEQA